MKKIRLNNLELGESSRLSTEEKKKTTGGFLGECWDAGQRCACDDGSIAMPIDFCTHTCPRECPRPIYI